VCGWKGTANYFDLIIEAEVNRRPALVLQRPLDTNHDGMISKKEFMKYHEDMWAKMKKNKSGMVDMKDMEMMHGSMMKDGTMMKDKTGK